MLKDYFKNISIDDLLNMPIDECFKDIMAKFEKIQDSIGAMVQKDDSKSLTAVKIGSVLTFAIINKIAHGQNLKNFTKEDWADIADSVNQYAICMADEDYSVFIFTLYANYIDVSAGWVEDRCSEAMITSIRALAEEIRSESDEFKNGDVDEVHYTEDCLWTCLEAMIKLTSATVGSLEGQEMSELAEACATMAFEYGRLVLYRKEQAILQEFLNDQCWLDDELKKKYDLYISEVNRQSEIFMGLIENAFAPDFKSRLNNSVHLAQLTGVKEQDILKNVNDVDAFFLD